MKHKIQIFGNKDATLVNNSEEIKLRGIMFRLTRLIVGFLQVKSIQNYLNIFIEGFENKNYPHLSDILSIVKSVQLIIGWFPLTDGTQRTILNGQNFL